MADIKLWNSKTRQKELFVPRTPDKVGMYVCGPTVYDRAHLGNARPVVVFDVLYRLMQHTYGADNVTYVRNFTDVDDKINARAAETNRPIEDITAQTIQWFHDDMDALGARRPTHEPRATAYIPQMVAMIETLIAGGHAYAVQGHVLFRVRSYKDYGALSGRTVDDMIAGARVEVSPFKEDPMDFVLWKPSDATQPGWTSPWGRGRPGWHIECSAMSHELLGASFDIHGGGLDLQFPHHENELAQSTCAHPHAEFARVWMHNEMLQVEGKKMSKSLGNFFTVRDLLDQGIPGEVIRFVLLGTHYRKPMDWTEAKAKEAEGILRKIAAFLERDAFSKPWVIIYNAKPPEEIVEALSSDLNTSLALTLVAKYLKNEQEAHLCASLRLLGFDLDSLTKRFAGFRFSAHENEYVVSTGMRSWGNQTSSYEKLQMLGDELFRMRKQAMQTKDFAEVDAKKKALTDAGVEVRMSNDGVALSPGPNFDPTKLESLK